MADTPVASPCIGACTIEPGTGFCAGCGRTREEIAAWLSAPEDMRRAIVAAASGRLALAAHAGQDMRSS